MKQSKNQVRALHSVVSHHECGTDPFTLDRLFKGKLAGMGSSLTGFCLAEMKTPQISFQRQRSILILTFSSRLALPVFHSK